jgi:acyl phosphate:glycerol-3-phosphate acyltransferase
MVMPVLAISIGYLAGSIPFAFLVARFLKGIDIRRSGSGNVGAANVLRTTGALTAVGVMLLDMAKGAGAVFCVQRLTTGDAAPAAAGVAAVIGHVYPVWLRFRGGKGVATAAGAFSILTPLAMLPAAGVFVLTVWLTRFISLGSIVATLALGPVALGLGAPTAAVAAAIVSAALIVFRHRTNIGRLRAGTERRIGQRVAL